jgi:hypothetical protein
MEFYSAEADIQREPLSHPFLADCGGRLPHRFAPLWHASRFNRSPFDRLNLG